MGLYINLLVLEGSNQYFRMIGIRILVYRFPSWNFGYQANYPSKINISYSKTFHLRKKFHTPPNTQSHQQSHPSQDLSNRNIMENQYEWKYHSYESIFKIHDRRD
jgi:hypothetical protein